MFRNYLKSLDFQMNFQYHPSYHKSRNGWLDEFLLIMPHSQNMSQFSTKLLLLMVKQCNTE